uniref:Uncharacterized protein n=1 Tax=Anopheles dirus TaxID=7168 RepID=A0A182NVW3_9DIPT
MSTGKLAYYSDRVPETVPRTEFWPNYDILPSEAYDAVHYPAWFQLPWKPIPYFPWPTEVETDQQNVHENEPEPTIPEPVDVVVLPDDETQESRHLHHEKPNKHHHHKHKHHKHKHHHHHHHNNEGSDEELKTTQEEEEQLEPADVGQLKKVMLQLERKLQELKLQLFGGRKLDGVDVADDDEDDAARFDMDEKENSYEHTEQPTQVPTERVEVAPTSTEADDEGKGLFDADVDKPASELEVEHRQVAKNQFDNGRSLAENVQMWFEGLDLAKIAELPLEPPESEDVSEQIDVRSGIEE